MPVAAYGSKIRPSPRTTSCVFSRASSTGSPRWRRRRFPRSPSRRPKPRPSAGPRAPAAHYATEVVSVRPDVPVRAAIAEMKERAVGCVVVSGEAGELLGVLTDRDVALRVVARGADPEATPVSAVMSAPAFSCGASSPALASTTTTCRAGTSRTSSRAEPPGYYDNEGKLSERAAQNGFYGAGSVAFFALLAACTQRAT